MIPVFPYFIPHWFYSFQVGVTVLNNDPFDLFRMFHTYSLADRRTVIMKVNSERMQLYCFGKPADGCCYILKRVLIALLVGKAAETEAGIIRCHEMKFVSERSHQVFEHHR